MKLPAIAATLPGGARWAVSFADLCLLLLGFLLLLQAHKGDPGALNAGLRAAFGAPAPASYDTAAAPLFQPGEAALLPDARARYVAIGRQAAGQGGVVHIESLGTDSGGQRLDAWELAAARTAAIARAIGSGGVAAGRIDVSIDGTGPVAPVRGQHVRVTIGR